jgi:transcription antitermination factor NusB
MTGRAGDEANIPARLTAKELAEAIGRDVVEVTSILRAKGEPDSPQDFVDSQLAKEVADVLGARVTVEQRDMTLEALYEYELRGELAPGPGGRAGQMARDVIDALEELDQLIEEASEHWSVARMPLIDRNILRLGLSELRNHPETPSAVIISEAVRLAKTYSTGRSGSFVNGVLATLATKVRD